MKYHDLDSQNATPERLVNVIKAHGVPTEQDAKNDFADFINACSRVLDDALNLNADVIMFALVNIWDPMRVISYFNCTFKSAVQERERVRGIERQLSDAHVFIEKQRSEIANVTESAKAITHSWVESQEQVKALAAELESRNLEIIRLKAKLYDLMIA